MTNGPMKPSGWLRHPGALLLAAIVGAAVATMLVRGGTTLFGWNAIKQPAGSQGQPLLPGDEPPIRVRGGSLHLDLLSTADEWEEDGDKKKWKIKSGPRGKDTLDVVVLLNTAGRCGASTWFPIMTGSGTKLEIAYSDGSAKLDVQAQSRHTKVKFKFDLKPNGPRQLDYDGSGYISGVTLRGGSQDLSCTFTSKAQLDHLLILDF